MTHIGNTEALEKYLKLERDNNDLLRDVAIYRGELAKMQKAYSDVSGKIDSLFNWLETRKDTKTETVRRKMAELFKFAYMESQFEDLRAKWDINQTEKVKSQ